jgi:nicotinate-nucleotide pyrophosphorylase (carboxylating)
MDNIPSCFAKGMTISDLAIKYDVFWLRQTLACFLREDIRTGDITSNAVVSASRFAEAEIICKTDGATLCGTYETEMIFDICNCITKSLIREGSEMRAGSTVMNVQGSALAILQAERTALNILMRMSGIATETRRLVNIVNDKSVRIAATRKTAPGLRYFDKKAVIVGGGHPHRIALDDMVLIKDNHLVIAGSVQNAIDLARKNLDRRVKVECEAKNPEEAIEAIAKGVDIVLLDNFSEQQVEKTILEIERRKMRKNVLIEVSGGINQSNISGYAKAKPDIISVGYITHSPHAVDFSLEICRSWDQKR